MPTALEVALQVYAHEQVTTYLKGEYDSQINAWKRHINLMVDAQAEALNRHQKTLDEARKQIEKEREANFAIAMLALSLVSGPALSWVAGKIQTTWYPKLASKPRERVQWVSTNDRGYWEPIKVLELDHDKVWAKVFGDLGKQVTGWGTDKALKVVTPPSGAAQNAIVTAASSPDLGSFRTRLENALLAEADLTSKAILNLGWSIHDSSDYGAECLQNLKRANPRARDPKVGDRELLDLAKQMISADIDAQRKKWADEWFYYGNDPGTTAGLAESIEREMWGLWTLNERLQFKTTLVRTGGPDYQQMMEIPFVESATFGDRGVPEPVLKRLGDFGVVFGRTKQQRWEETQRWEELNRPVPTEDDLRRAFDPSRREETLRAAKESLRGTTVCSRSPEPETNWSGPSPEKEQREECNRRAVEEFNRLNSTHPPTADRPVIKVGSAVDTQQEVDALESWAKRHPLALGAGQLRHRKRTLRPLASYYSSP
jgi:hypothetical protein